MSGTDPIEAGHRKLADVFSDAYAFEVPGYQRPYAWEEEQAGQLLDDLLDALDRTGRERTYFLGSVVLVKEPGMPSAKVLDGQQRLTTLTILLAVLRDLTKDRSKRESRAKYVNQAADPDRGIMERPRLIPRERDRGFFRQVVQADGGTAKVPAKADIEVESQARVAGNVNLFRRRLSKLEEARRDDLLRFVLNECYLVVISVPTPEGARRIFTVLNSRGLDLAPTDILKARFLDGAPPALVDEFSRRWEDAETTLGRDGFVALFGLVAASFGDRGKAALDDGFPKAVPLFSEPGRFLDEVLEPAVGLVSALSNREALRARHGRASAQRLRALARLPHEDWLPLLLLAQRIGKDLGAILPGVERLAYYHVVVGAKVTASERAKRWARARAVVSGASDPDGDPFALSPLEVEAMMSVLRGDIYKAKRLCRPVMLRLDDALAAVDASYDEPVTIEHVLPQTVEAGSEWEATFRDPIKRGAQANQLGNLVFLTGPANSRASNLPFRRKKDEYFSDRHGMSPYPLTVDVLRRAAWDEAALRERQARLLAKLCDVWGLDAGQPAVAAPAREKAPRAVRGRRSAPAVAEAAE